MVCLMIADRFFSGAAYRRESPLYDSAQIRMWWEERRLFYNKVVGCCGVVTCALMIFCGFVSQPVIGQPIGVPDPPALVPLAIIVYGIGANICYTGGRIAESLLLRNGVAATNEFGVRAFRVGMKFSVVLTLLPAVLSWTVFLLGLIGGRHSEILR